MRALTLALMLPLAACNFSWSDEDDGKPGVPASGSGNVRSFAVTDFTSVEQSGPDDVDIRVGSGFSVRAEGDSGELDRLKIERRGDALRIGRKNSIGWGGSEGVKVYVTMPRVTGASLAGAGDMSVDRVEGASFDGSIAGAGTLTLGTVAVQALSLKIAGAGDAVARGDAGALKVSIAGSGNVDGQALKATGAEVRIAGSGSVKALVDGAATVSIMGSGDVDLGPKARCETKKMGSGSVKCGSGGSSD